MTSSFHSVRKIKTKGLQNTVQLLAVTNKVASGNNVFAKNASVRHLTGIVLIYIYIIYVYIKIKYALKQHSQIPSCLNCLCVQYSTYIHSL